VTKTLRGYEKLAADAGLTPLEYLTKAFNRAVRASTYKRNPERAAKHEAEAIRIAMILLPYYCAKPKPVADPAPVQTVRIKLV
jgi:hypothetical protein